MTFTQKQLKEISEECVQKIMNARGGIEYFDEPFRHLVIDNFLEQELARVCLQSFPSLDESGWEASNDIDIEIKYRTTWSSEFDIPEGIIDAVRILNCGPLIKAMGDRIGIHKLIPDPYFTGGGLNVTTKGGLLDVHVDGNYHDATSLNRRVNAILYLNQDWLPEYGGEFGLYDQNGDICLKKVLPIFNRLVVFDTNDFSFHGLPSPLSCPKGMSRKSIILYYYTKEPRPGYQIAVNEPHSALWKKLNMLDKRGNKVRNFT